MQMYNSITEEKIKQIPQIGDIEIDQLPQELTRIFAQIVGIRRRFAEETVNTQSDELIKSVNLTQTLANNLETILLLNPNHEQKESIAFVAATAHSLILKINLFLNRTSKTILEIDTITPLISAIILFLIGNSQADASEMSNQIFINEELNLTKKKLVSYIQGLGNGKLMSIIDNPFLNEDIETDNLQDAALDYLWKELGLGIYAISETLMGITLQEKNDSFQNVIDLSVSSFSFKDQKSIFTGPYHLAKLLKILESEILKRGVIDIPPPIGINAKSWKDFLKRLAQERPYLWENHKTAVDTNFLDPGISSVITLPTGAGKSTLVELKIASCIYSGRKVIYLVPTHALENQVRNSLRTLFEEFNDDQIDIDGEYSEFGVNISSSISVMTPERCLTLLNMSSELQDNLGLIIFDEFHLISETNINKDRRSIDAMYCLISLFTFVPNADFLLISAMVENGKEIADWLETVLCRDCKLFDSSWKPTRQLHGCLIFQENEISNLTSKIHKELKVSSTKNPPKKLQDEMSIFPYCLFSLKNIWETDDNTDYHRIKILDEKILLKINNNWNITANRNDVAAKLGSYFSKIGLKTLIFVNSPIYAKSVSKKMNTSLIEHLNCFNEFVQLNISRKKSLELELGNIKYSYFNSDNVGVHHGLLLPIERILIEQFFKESNGSIALIATATIAQGINLPAEIVIIAGDDRYNEDLENRERIPPHELLNAAGRAGRAGLSAQGAVILIPGEMVTIRDSTISNRWWDLKREVFSKSDQCLNINDPMEYFLDSIQDEAEPLSPEQLNILYRFKAESLSETETRNLFRNSLSAYKADKNKTQDIFNMKVENLIKRRNELDELSDDIIWTKEISFQTGIDPILIQKLGKAIEEEKLENFVNLTIIEYVDWFFDWMQKDKNFIIKIYTKQGTIKQINKVIGLSPDNNDTDMILKLLPILKMIIFKYISGNPLDEIDQFIQGKSDEYLTKARNFSIRLIPEISFSFGLLSVVTIEKAKHKHLQKRDLPLTLRCLASCIKEGFDNVDKLLFKNENYNMSRVEVHKVFSSKKNIP